MADEKPQVLATRVRVEVVIRAELKRASFDRGAFEFALQGLCEDVEYRGRGTHGAYVWEFTMYEDSIDRAVDYFVRDAAASTGVTDMDYTSEVISRTMVDVDI